MVDDAVPTYVASPETGRMWLAGLGVRDATRGFRDLRDLARHAETSKRYATLLERLAALLPQCGDPGLALTNLERFVAAHEDPNGCLEGLLSDARRIDTLVGLLGASPYFGERLIAWPEWLDAICVGRRDRGREALVAELWSDMQGADPVEAREIVRRFRHRETIRIGAEDVLRGAPLEVTTQDLSDLADACVEAAYRHARRQAVARHGEPRNDAGEPAAFTVLGLGKLGGRELNYSSDIDLIYLYDDEGRTDGERSITNAEFFARVGGDIVRLLADHTAGGQAYRVDMRLRPEGDQGPLARSLGATLGYYETSGRTWERQALMKCRPIAGDTAPGAAFLAAIAPFVHRRYLSAVEIGEIKAMKRRIEVRTKSTGGDLLEVKTGRGGIRDVEFVVQFLQLLHGGSYPEVRDANTLNALAKLEAVGCLAPEEREIMESTYRFLRKVEHRLQILFDRQTHRMPTDLEEQRSLAVRMGYPPISAWEDRVGPAQRFLADYRAKTDLNRRILDHLLHDAFTDDPSAPASHPVTDLVLDPEPTAEAVAAALTPYRFRDRDTAYRNLTALAREDFAFLSQARCRHFFAAIAGRLLEAVGATQEPDLTLTNLEKVSASLGAKGVLWELFNFNPPTLRLYVELCARSPFLSEILINNPGMIDDLMDSLVVDRPQPAPAIRKELAALCKGAEDLEPTLLGFRNKEWVRIGTRDILSREPIREVTRELADVAEAIVVETCRDAWERRIARQGIPRMEDGRRARWAVLALGKLGGRELSYHGDLDLIFVYEGDGATRSTDGTTIANSEFFTELVRSVLRTLAGRDGRGALYSIDTRLRPHGSSGPLVLPLDAFTAYYRDASRAWERQALTRARVVHAVGDFGDSVRDALRSVLAVPVDRAALAREVLAMRRRLEASAGPRDLKRRPGGITDIEFLVQFLMLVRAHEDFSVVRPNLWEALEGLRKAGVLDEPSARMLSSAYDRLRAAEGRLRLTRHRATSEIPETGGLGDGLSDDFARTRALFDSIVTRAAAEGAA